MMQAVATGDNSGILIIIGLIVLIAAGVGLATIAIVPQNVSIVLQCGKRFLNISASELQERLSTRNKAGTVLPRGFQKVDRITVNLNAKSDEEDFSLV